MEASEQRRIIEALILASGEPISLARIAEIVPDCTPGVAKDRINELNTEYQEQDRAFEVWEVAGGFQIRTRAEFSGYLQQLRKERPLRLSQASLETLSIIAYKQPATRAELEAVRGVDGGAVLKSLLDRRLIKIVGHREVPGRPLLYGTSKRFLSVFGLESLKNLPSLRELEELAQEQGIDLPFGSDDENDGLEEGADVLDEAAADDTLDYVGDEGDIEEPEESDADDPASAGARAADAAAEDEGAGDPDDPRA